MQLKYESWATQRGNTSLQLKKTSQNFRVDMGNSVTLHASRICKIAKIDFRKLVGLDYQEGDLTAERLITTSSAKGWL